VRRGDNNYSLHDAPHELHRCINDVHRPSSDIVLLTFAVGTHAAPRRVLCALCASHPQQQSKISGARCHTTTTAAG
jgi:hypothetical protein